MKYRKLIFSLLFFVILGCKDDPSFPSKSSKNVLNSIANTRETNPDPNEYYSKNDSLKPEEVRLFKLLQKENPNIIFENHVERIISAKNEIVLSNKLILSQDYLNEKGYISYEFQYYGEISKDYPLKIVYEYNMGQADYGYGTVIGSHIGDYSHVITGYGLSAKAHAIFDNGQQLSIVSNTIER